MKASPRLLTLSFLSLCFLLLFLSCDENILVDEEGIYIRLKNDTGSELNDLNYSFGFEEETRFVDRITPGRASLYHRFENADRCSGIFLEGTVATGSTIEFGRALCAIPAPIAPGCYSFVIREIAFTRNDGTTGTFIQTDIIEES